MTERIRYLAYPTRGRGDYTDEPWRAMRDGDKPEPEPVSDEWLKVFGLDARAKEQEHRD